MIKAIKFSLGISSFIVVLALGFFFRDTFEYRSSLHLNENRSGVVFHDRWRATHGYHLIDNYVHSRSCEIIDEGGRWESLELPGSFCTLLDDGSYVAAGTRRKFMFFNPQGHLVWSKNIHTHHDMWVDRQRRKIFILSGDVERKPGDKIQTREDAVLGYDFEGNLIFEWRFRDRKNEVEAALGEKTDRYDIAGMYHYTHINSVQLLPINPWSKQNSAFRAGNVLVNCARYRLFFILDQGTGEIVWTYRAHDWESAHSLRMNDQGMMVFLSNVQLEWDGPNFTRVEHSSVRILNPMTRSIIANIMLNPQTDFYTSIWGSLQLLPNGHFMVTSSRSGVAFEMNDRGRILWEWISPKNEPGKPFPVYRVTWVPAELFDQKLPRWLQFH